MFKGTVIGIGVLLLFTMTSYGQSLQGSCVPKHCTCTVSNTTAIPAQPFNVATEDWRPIVLATALGAATSSLLLTSMAVWWTWKSSGLGLPDAPSPDKPSMNPRGGSPSTSSNGSWATQRNRPYPSSDNEWASRPNSIGSYGYSNEGKPGKRVWPGQFD